MLTRASWQHPKPFLVLAGACLIGFPIFVVLHNLLWGLGQTLGDTPVARPVVEFLHVATFLIAVFVCPVGLLVSLVGAAVTALRRRRQVE